MNHLQNRFSILSVVSGLLLPPILAAGEVGSSVQWSEAREKDEVNEAGNERGERAESGACEEETWEMMGASGDRGGVQSENAWELREVEGKDISKDSAQAGQSAQPKDSTQTKRDTLKAAKVVAKVKVLQSVGDTLVYNVAATQSVSNEDMLIDVLSRLPGVEVKDGQVFQLGKRIDKIYINGKLVFGNDPRNALNYLAGQEVLKIAAYDQLRDEDRLLGRQIHDKERVLNVKTRHFIDRVLAAQAILSAGSNIEKRGDESDLRYHGNLAGNYFSEKNLLSANFSLGNVGRGQDNIQAIHGVSRIPSNYTRSGYAGISFQSNLSDNGSDMSASYSYGNDYSMGSSRLTRDYTVEDRHYFNESLHNSLSKSHNLNAAFRSNYKYIPSIYLSLSMTDNNSSGQSYMQEGLTEILSRNGSKSRLKNINLSTGKSYSLLSNLFFSWNGIFTYGDTNGDGSQRDSSSTAQTLYLTQPQDNSIGFSLTPMLRWLLNDKNSIDIHYNFQHDNSHRKLLRFVDEVAEANLDSLLSENYFQKGTNQKISLSFSHRDKSTWNLGLNYDLYSMSEDRSLPATGPVQNRVFSHFAPELIWQISDFSKGLNASIQFFSRQRVPSIEQLSEVVDNTSALYISSGNPDLRQARTYSLSTTLSKVKSPNSLSTFFRASVTDGSIVEKSTYYSEGATVRGFQLLPGATYTTWVNASSPSYNASIGVDHSFYWTLIRSKLFTGITYDYSAYPVYADGEESYTYNHRPRINFRYDSAFSKKHKLTARADYSPVFTSSKAYGRTSWQDESFIVESRNSLPWNLFLNASYSHHGRFTSGRKTMFSNMLNAIAGIRLLDGDLEFSLACYDILGDEKAFTTKYIQNYVQTSMRDSFGRIFLVNVVYSFNSTKHGGRNIRFGRGDDKIGERYEGGSKGYRF